MPPSWQTTASILPRVLHITAPASVLFSKYLQAQTLPIGHDALVIDPIQVVAGSLRWGPAAGLPRAATLGDLTIQGPGAGNYVLDQPTLTTVATVNAPLPLPGVSGGWLCSSVGRGCGTVADTAPHAQLPLLSVMAAAGNASPSPALVIKRSASRCPRARLQGDGE